AFFFSSRRRHTTLQGDWSSDVCSSDLLLISEFYTAVKDEKKWVKVGISPFGIWRPGVPPTTTAGVDIYDELYADARKWLRDGSQIGRASCRERVWRAVGAVSGKMR